VGRLSALETLAMVAFILAAVILAAVAYGELRWQARTRALRAGLEAARLPIESVAVRFGELGGLPAPVERYLRSVLKEGQPLVTGVRVRHRGTFNASASSETWKRFESDQQVVIRRPGFDWDARISMLPGLSVRVHDAYVAGEGILEAALLGLLPVADLRGTREIARGELMRFLAETAWYPTALLPSQGVRWEAIDGRSARATLADGALSVGLLFVFNDDGLIDTVRAEARGRTVGKQILPTPWSGRFWNYAERGGMCVPLDGEVAWLLPEGARPYWRGRIAEIRYETAAASR
jgi:hypothetical protein